MNSVSDYNYISDFLNKGSLLEVLGGTSKPVGKEAHEIVWNTHPSRVAGSGGESNKKWANAWMELFILASETLKDKEDLE